MMRVFMAILCSLLAVCSVSARNRRHEGTDGQAAIYRLPPFERAVRCTKYFEGWHSEKHHPYVGWGHKLLPNEKYSARTMTKWDADELLRKDLRKFVAMFRKFGVDSTLLGTLAYNVGPAKLLGSKTLPKSTLIRKLEAGDRNIYREYIAFCNYKGKRHAMLLKRRKAEFALLYVP
ncbi:glycoside hydrolase family protein [Ornithobacterium rhinotracheale]|uniref:glycoside hydrolase family protein n=1 Tax=Ornithobacterium rhinotracheale TaxID=28251 RepID=UPI00215905C7|nr:lysozyme [Ornithobacterium rhinotracheale]UVD87018.1 lysozyme [Ornithobacterium rhinotracheale]